MLKPTIQFLIKKHFKNYKPNYQGLEFNGEEIIPNKNSISIKEAKAFLKEVEDCYTFSIKENVIVEPLDSDEDTNVYFERYYLGNGFRLYTD